jgi:hypothetical protein
LRTATDASRGRDSDADPDAPVRLELPTHVAANVLSVFEPHTETIRKGRIATVLNRCRHDGDDGMHRWVGFGISPDQFGEHRDLLGGAARRTGKSGSMKRPDTELAARSSQVSSLSGHFFTGK